MVPVSSKSVCAGAVLAIRYARVQQAEVNVVAAVQRQILDLFPIYQSTHRAARRLYYRRSTAPPSTVMVWVTKPTCSEKFKLMTSET
jgi:hypothetical protein